MWQAGIPYELVGPDGTRVVFNDSSDPDFVGYLDGDNGITGLGTAPVRENAEEKVEGDGGVHGAFYLDRRPITINGWISPDPDPTAVGERSSRIKRASRGLREDCELLWQNDGRPRTRLLLRRQTANGLSGRRPKVFQLGLVCADHRIFAADEQFATVAISGAGSASGFTFPLTFDLTFGTGVPTAVAQMTVVNAGDIETPPRFRIDGPIQNPTILNNTTGEQIRLAYTLGVDEFLIVDVADHSVKLAGTTNRYSAYDFDLSTWWELQPGANDVRVLADSYASPAALTTYWRDAFE